MTCICNGCEQIHSDMFTKKTANMEEVIYSSMTSTIVSLFEQSCFLSVIFALMRLTCISSDMHFVVSLVMKRDGQSSHDLTEILP